MVEPWRIACGLIIVALAAGGVWRKIDVRLCLFPAGLALATVGGQPLVALQAFFNKIVAPEFVVPICFAVGFASVLKHTGCDAHLVRLLIRPLTRARELLVPGTVLVGFAVNVPIVSQTGTAAAIGPILLPILLAAGVSPLSAGAALLVGSSLGGELFNPGGTNYPTIVAEIERLAPPRPLPSDCVAATAPYNVLSLCVTTIALWWLTRRADQRSSMSDAPRAELVITLDAPVSYLKAATPLVPLALLALTAPPFGVFEIPHSWLVGESTARLFDSRLIGVAMLCGVAAAAATSLVGEDRRRLAGIGGAFFEGMGFGFKEIISLIAVAATFAEGIEQVGFGQAIQAAAGHAPRLLAPLAGYLTLTFAVLCGSGIAATNGLFRFFAESAVQQGLDPLQIGAITAIGAEAGRTMSPVAAVTFFCARQSGVSPTQLAARVAPPVLLGATAAILLAAWRQW